MYNILGELNKTNGVIGSMVVGSDGIIIAADLDSRYEDETVGALASSIVTNISKAMDRLDQPQLNTVTVEAENGKIFINDAGVGILAVMTEPEVNIGMVRLEIKNAVSKIKGQ